MIKYVKLSKQHKVKKTLKSSKQNIAIQNNTHKRLELLQVRSEVTDPDDAVGGAGHDDVLAVPLATLGERHAEDLLHAVGVTDTRVHTRQLLSVDTPQMQPGAGTSRNVTLHQQSHQHRSYLLQFYLHLLFCQVTMLLLSGNEGTKVVLFGRTTEKIINEFLIIFLV